MLNDSSKSKESIIKTIAGTSLGGDRLRINDRQGYSVTKCMRNRWLGSYQTEAKVLPLSVTSCDRVNDLTSEDYVP